MKLTKFNLLTFCDNYMTIKEKSFKEINEQYYGKEKNYLTEKQIFAIVELKKMINRLATDFED